MGHTIAIVQAGGRENTLKQAHTQQNKSLLNVVATEDNFYPDLYARDYVILESACLWLKDVISIQISSFCLKFIFISISGSPRHSAGHDRDLLALRIVARHLRPLLRHRLAVLQRLDDDARALKHRRPRHVPAPQHSPVLRKVILH